MVLEKPIAFLCSVLQRWLSNSSGCESRRGLHSGSSCRDAHITAKNIPLQDWTGKEQGAINNTEIICQKSSIVIRDKLDFNY